MKIADGQLELHTSVSPDGAPVTFGHTVLDLPDTDAIAWRGKREVKARSLGSLVDGGEIPARVGIVRSTLRGRPSGRCGMGDLESDVVMVEHWTDLQPTLGPCPWTTDEMLSKLRHRGFFHFTFIAQFGDFVILQWDDGEVPRGYVGNLVFLHARVLESLHLTTLEVGSSLAKSAVEVVELYVTAANDRLAVINEVSRSRLGRLLLRRIRDAET